MRPTTYRAECTFCRILAGEEPAAVVFRDERTLAFMDISPVTRGHTLVIPIEHYRDLYAMPDDLAQALMLTGVKVVRAVKTAFGAAGVNLWLANERPAGQVVFHAHLHVMPRYHDDGIRLYAPGRTRSSPPALENTAAEIRSALEGLSHD